MRVGVLGGTFDPVHVGHLVIADAAREALELDLVLFVPAGEPWRKSHRTITPAEHRLAMLRLAIEGNDAFGISDVELRRHGPSYTVDTLAALAAERLDDQFWFIVGADALADLLNWHEPARIVEHARLAAVARGGHAPAMPPALSSALAGRIDHFDAPALDVSSTGIRARIASGRSVRYLIPAAVERYIFDHGLYAR